MRPGAKRAKDATNVRGQEEPNTAKLVGHVVRVAMRRGCDLRYLQTLLQEEWDREVKRLSDAQAKRSVKDHQ